ncbi:hypothetical protein FPANT_9944 [Fusarium pseudoanthophilum]|uniref:Uncharacterized protein n=1 Tax=Fusarium pseudoanthophilum TaxID=48495 RepID=A0A8H5KQC7_9HYPO|nr:hypothetical protein FPANT_9944 [Fusarium pseudoanthophilum]
MEHDRFDLSSALHTSRDPAEIYSTGPCRTPDPVYGGLLMGRAVTAAANGIRDRECHSVQATFVRRAKPELATQFNVTEAMTGNNFTIRHVTATQDDKEIFSANVSFRKPRLGFEHTSDKMPQVSLPSKYDTDSTRRMHPRPVPAGIEAVWTSEPDGENICVWIRSKSHLENNSAVQTAALLYASDYPILEAGLLRHGLSWRTAGLFTASLTHSAWLMRQSDFNDWHLFCIRSLAASEAHGLAVSHTHSRSSNDAAGHSQKISHWFAVPGPPITATDVAKAARRVVASIAKTIEMDWLVQLVKLPPTGARYQSPGPESPGVVTADSLSVGLSEDTLGDDDLVTLEQQSRNHEDSQLEDSLSENIDTDEVILDTPPAKPTETSHTPKQASCSSGSGGNTTANALSSLFVEVFQYPDDEATFTYYLRRVSSCTTSYDSDRNPYRRLAMAALSYPVLLHSILAVSTAHMEMFGQSNRSILYSRQSQALKSLRTALKYLNLEDDQGPDTQKSIQVEGVFAFHSPGEITLAAVIMQTSSVLMMDLSNIGTHMTYALYLIQYLGYMSRPPRSSFLKTLIYRFSMVDVVLAFVQSTRPRAPLDFYKYQDSSDELDQAPSFLEMHGCHRRVLSYLAQIANLSAELIESESRKSAVQAAGYDLETEMRLWGRNYCSAMTSESKLPDSSTTSSGDEINSRADLEVVCECFYWTAHLVLLRRVFLDPTNSTRVQLIRRHMFRLMDGLASGCGPDSSLPFPFYIAACEAMTSADRSWVRKRHTAMLNTYRDRARESLMASVEGVWARAEASAVSDTHYSEAQCRSTVDNEASHFWF